MQDPTIGGYLHWVHWDPAEIRKRVRAMLDAKRKYNGIITRRDKGRRTFRNTVIELDRTNTAALELEGQLTVLRDASPNVRVRTAAKQGIQKLAGELIRINYTRELYAVLVDCGKRFGEQLDPIDRRLLADYLGDYRRNGAALDVAGHAEFQDNKQLLIELEREAESAMNEFVAEIVVRPEDAKGVSEELLQNLEQTNDGDYKVSLDNYRAFMEQCTRASTRRRLAKLFLSRAPMSNVLRYEKILRLRARNAELVGYSDFATVQLEPMVAGSPKPVMDFLDRLEQRIKPEIEGVIKAMTEIKRQHTKNRKARIQYYDLVRYSKLLKDQRAGVNLSAAVPKYLPLELTLDKILGFYQNLFGIRITLLHDVETWHPDVQVYSIHDFESNELLGYFLFDPFYRRGKFKGNAQELAVRRSWKSQDGKRDIPVSCLMCNLPKPRRGRPSFLSHLQASNEVAHEIGHGLHDLITQARHGKHAGVFVSWDMVEVPSILIEQWWWTRQFLQQVTAHYQTGAPMPDELIDALLRSRREDFILWAAWNICYARWDLMVHTTANPPSANEMPLMLVALMERLTGVRLPADNTFPAWFNHFFGDYACMYSTYLRDSGIAIDLFSEFVGTGLDNPETGMRWRRLVLEHGGQYGFMELVTEFLGRPPQEDAIFRLLDVA